MIKNELDHKQLHQLAASAILRAPMDVTSILLNESNDIVSAVLQDIEPHHGNRCFRHGIAAWPGNTFSTISDGYAVY